MRTIVKYALSPDSAEQQFRIRGWEGVAAVLGSEQFANEIEVYCHVNDDKNLYLARFRVTATGQEAPKPRSDFVYCGLARCMGNTVWHVWRNAVTEKVQDEGPF